MQQSLSLVIVYTQLCKVIEELTVLKERESLNIYTRTNIAREVHTRHKESNVRENLIFLWGSGRDIKEGFPGVVLSTLSYKKKKKNQ